MKKNRTFKDLTPEEQNLYRISSAVGVVIGMLAHKLYVQKKALKKEREYYEAMTLELDRMAEKYNEN